MKLEEKNLFPMIKRLENFWSKKMHIHEKSKYEI